MTGFYKDYADSSDTHQNSAEASADAAEVSANEAATSASQSSTYASQSSTYASQAAASLAAQEDLEVTNVTFSSSTGVLSLTKPNETISTNIDGRYAELSGGTFIGDIVLNGAELISNSNLDFRVDADNNDTTSSFRVFNDNNVSASFEVNSLGNVFIDSGGLYEGLPRDHNKLAIGAMAVASASTAPLGIKANSSFQTLALQSNDNSSTVKFNVLNDGTLNIGTPVTTNLSLSYDGDLTVNSGGLNVDGGLLYVDANNNKVGINTTTPHSTLAVGNDGTEYRIYPEGLISNGTLVSSYIPNSSIYGSILTRASLHRWGIGADEKMRIDDTGYVGINNNNPSEALDVTGNIAVSGTVDGVDIATLGANAIVDGDFTSNGFMKRDGAGVYSVDSSTYATETYVDTAVSNLVDSAPATLDTLNELASALGDDANFSTTVTNSIGTKWTEDATKISNWDTAYSWGNHASAGYLTAHQDISGKADLTGADFTGNVTTTGTLATGGYTLSSTDGTSGQALVTDGSGNVSFGDVTVDVSGKADLSGADFTGDVTTTGTLATGGYTLSSTDGTNGQVLITDGSGNVSFGDVSVSVSGKADLSGANFTGDVTVEEEYPTLSQLFTTSRTPEELANWARYLVSDIPDGYSNADPNYRDALDTNQDGVFSSSDVYAINIFVANNYNSTDESTYTNIVNGTNPDNSTFVTDVLNGEYNTSTFSTDITNNRVGINTVNPNATLDVNGDIAVSGTVDGVDIAALDTSKADLSGANFTGNVFVEKEYPTVNDLLTTSRTIEELANWTRYVLVSDYDTTDVNYRDALDANQNGRFSSSDWSYIATFVSNNYTATEYSTYNDIVSGTISDNSTFVTDVLNGEYDTGTFGTDIANNRVGINTVNPNATLDVNGDIAVSGTVDGRDVATDGTKLDGIDAGANASYNYASRIHGAYTTIPTSPIQLGYDFYLRNHSNSYYKRFVEYSMFTNYFNITSTNDFNFRTILVVPSSSGNAVNIGDVESITTTAYYNREIVLSGDVTHWFSDYSGIATNSNGTNAFTSVIRASYNPSTDKTTAEVGVYGMTPPGTGDSIYVHPFDWETSGSELFGWTHQYDLKAGNASSYNINDRVYLGNIDRTVTCRFKAYKSASSDSLTVQWIKINQTDEKT